jgi:hypothetical protein
MTFSLVSHDARRWNVIFTSRDFLHCDYNVLQSFFHLSRQTTMIKDLLVQRQFSLVSDKRYYYMTSDNVFSDWLTPLVTFFDKTL